MRQPENNSTSSQESKYLQPVTMLPTSKHPLVRQQSDTTRQVLSRQESGSSRGVPDPSASLDAIHPPDRSSPYTSDIEHGITSGSVSPIDPPSNQVRCCYCMGNSTSHVYTLHILHSQNSRSNKYYH